LFPMPLSFRFMYGSSSDQFLHLYTSSPLFNKILVRPPLCQLSPSRNLFKSSHKSPSLPLQFPSQHLTHQSAPYSHNATPSLLLTFPPIPTHPHIPPTLPPLTPQPRLLDPVPLVAPAGAVDGTVFAVGGWGVFGVFAGFSESRGEEGYREEGNELHDDMFW
jgi:hypothetical protein